MAKEKTGFGGQWVEIFTTGTHTDNKGNKHEIDASFLEQVVANFKPDLHEPPAVVGHPEDNAPAYGWVCGLRKKDDRLEALFCDNDPSFEEMVKTGRFKKRSSSFYLNPATAPGGRAPSLQHVGFLGARPPAVKGLREIHFDEGEAITFETANFSGGEDMADEDAKPVREQIADYFRDLFGGKNKETQASFTEADLDARIKRATDAISASFTEQVTALKTENQGLRERLDNYSGSATRTEIVAFCERLGAGKFLPAFKSMGVIEFMETLASIPDKKVNVISFAEEGGREVEKKVEITPLTFFQNFLQSLPPFIEFGERFGELKVKGDGALPTDPEEVKGLRQGMGLKEPEGGKQ